MSKAKVKGSRRGKDPNTYPPGWDLRRTQAIADFYDSRKDNEFLADVEPGVGVGQVWVEVPQELLPKVLKLIEKSRKSA